MIITVMLEKIKLETTKDNKFPQIIKDILDKFHNQIKYNN